MQRKPGYPIANCNIKMPDSVPLSEAVPCDDDGDQHQRRLQLINFAHAQWGFNNWSWSVNKQDLDFVDFANGKYCAGVVAFVSVAVKSLDIHRENIGYATCVAAMKGSAIHQARKCAVTNALRETLLSFGGAVTSELLESLESRPEPAPQPCVEPPPAEPLVKSPDPKTVTKIRKDSVDSTASNPVNMRHPLVPIKNAIQNQPPPVAKALPMPANLPPAANRALAPRPPAPHVRPNSNVSFVLQPVLGAPPPPVYAPPPRHVHPQMYPNYYEYAGPWFAYESYDRHHGNVNLNFNIPPKNLVVNSRTGVECKNACGVRPVEGEPVQYAPQNQGCWIKPTIFYDGFWTEQKVKKWVAEQVEKQFPEDPTKSPSPSHPADPKS